MGERTQGKYGLEPGEIPCCICGGGPAGIMLGFLLARAGIEVLILEKHKDFFRDFRGDTIHPSTIQLMDELGLLDQFIEVPHQEMKQLHAQFRDTLIQVADFSHLPVSRPSLFLMPQWDFLNFLVRQGARYPHFRIELESEVMGLIWENGMVRGVQIETPGGAKEIRAGLVVGTDGRCSTVRKAGGLQVSAQSVPIDVLWFRLPKHASDPGQTLGRFDQGRIMILLDRGDYWQSAYIIEKDGFGKIQSAGMEAFREQIAAVSPFLRNRLSAMRNWEDVKLLSVAIDRLNEWCGEGILCIGDAAHAMSPIGGVGINLAIQDAVAAANRLWKPLAQQQRPSVKVLKSIQHRREFPTRVVQQIQVLIQRGIHSRKMDAHNRTIPLPFRILKRFPRMSRLTARLMGMGIRPEHIECPDTLQA